MNRMGINLKVTVDKNDLLYKLRVNREKHVAMYDEAVDGFTEAAKLRLQIEISRLAKTKGRKSVHFNITAPTNHAPEYDTVIHMLELHTGDTVTLHADEVRMLVEDEWSWMRSWLSGNSGYSASSRAYFSEKYGIGDDD